jgi:hypothetical protein
LNDEIDHSTNSFKFLNAFEVTYVNTFTQVLAKAEAVVIVVSA